MEAYEMLNGRRVRIFKDLGIFALGSFPAGLEGTIESANAIARCPDYLCLVKLDQHFPELNEWDNCLQVFFDDAECTPEYFELIIGFG